MKLLQRFNHPTSQICRTGSRNFSKTTKLYAAVPDNCKQPMKKSSKVHLEAKKSCQSFLECGPCSKFKYMDIVCKIALVTGGGSSIGFAIANELLCQNAHKVLIAHPNVEIGIKAVEALENVYGKDKACYIPLDFQKSEEFEEIFKIMHGKFGGIDILVNNTWPLNDYKWEHDVDANLKNIMRGTLAAMKWMPKERKSMKGGIVVNVASTGGLDSESMAPIWTGTKHGVVGLSKALGFHEHFLSNGVRVVCLCPGKDNPNDPLELKAPDQVKQYNQGVVRQPPGKVGSAVTYLIRYAPSGSVWVVENSTLFKTKIPDRKTFSKIVDLL